jgi:hypothetical protein
LWLLFAVGTTEVIITVFAYSAKPFLLEDSSKGGTGNASGAGLF